jgi:hypothetical protein
VIDEVVNAPASRDEASGLKKVVLDPDAVERYRSNPLG